jgi:hypothetical protein
MNLTELQACVIRILLEPFISPLRLPLHMLRQASQFIPKSL